MSPDQAIAAHKGIMPDLNMVVEFAAGRYHGVSRNAFVDGSCSPDLNIVSNNHFAA